MNKKIFAGAFALLLITGCGKKEGISAKKENKFNLNSKLTIKDIVDLDEKVTLSAPDEVIDTTKVGESVIDVIYIQDGEKKIKSVVINIGDTEKPVISCDDINTYVATNVNFEEVITVTDNSKEVIKPVISGEYDLEKEGTYSIKVTAKDSSGNEETKDCVLKVNPIKLKTNGYYVNKEPDTWHEFFFEDSGRAGYSPWFCPGSGCGGYLEDGTYEINGKTIKVNLTTAYGDVGEVIDISSSYEFTYINENELEYNGKKFKWQENFDD